MQRQLRQANCVHYKNSTIKLYNKTEQNWTKKEKTNRPNERWTYELSHTHTETHTSANKRNTYENMQGKQENACIFSISSFVSIRVKERTTFRTFMLVFVSNGEFFSLNTQERTCAKYENFHHYDGNFFWFQLKEVMTKMRKKNELTYTTLPPIASGLILKITKNRSSILRLIFSINHSYPRKNTRNLYEVSKFSAFEHLHFIYVSIFFKVANRSIWQTKWSLTFSITLPFMARIRIKPISSNKPTHVVTVSLSNWQIMIRIVTKTH